MFFTAEKNKVYRCGAGCMGAVPGTDKEDAEVVLGAVPGTDKEDAEVVPL
jgi:hypothetical protein